MRLVGPLLLLLALLLTAVWLDRSPPRADLVLAHPAEAFTLDPQRLSHQHDVRTSRALFEGLTEIDGVSGEPVPAAAESWRCSPDGLTWTFRLRPDLAWSDGTPLEARDFVYAWRRALLPDLASDYTGFLMPIRGARAFFEWRTAELQAFAQTSGGAEAAESLWKRSLQRFDDTVGLHAPDARTLVVQLERPVPYWPDLCAFPTMFPVPRHVVDRFTRLSPVTGMLQQDAGWTKAGTLVSNGPYTLVAWRPKRLIRLERNPRFRGAGEVAAGSIDIVPIEDPNTTVLAFENGAVDWVTDTLAEYRGDLLDQARAGDRTDLHVLDAFGTDFFSFNCRPTLADGRPNPFAKPGVRRAFALSVDRQALVDRITRLGERVATTLVPPGSIPGYAGPKGLGLDPERARAEMQSAGWRRTSSGWVDAMGDPFPTVEVLYATNSPRYRDLSTALTDMWMRELGVPCVTRSLDPRGFRDALQRGDFMVARGGWYGDYGDPTTWLDLSRREDGNNDRGFDLPAYDSLLDQAASELDPARRLGILAEAERLLMDEQVPVLPICHYVTVYMYEPTRLEGISRHARLEQYPGRLRRRTP
ncbi:MAG: peptide ABC transporter substrate-binding protein [Planctomycetes bacterium]|nr:peptide ABC transporter substrate-binding protein [Planctomycetota bacterium]